MKKITLYLVAALSFLLLTFPAVASADDVFGTACQGSAANSAVCQEGQNATGNPLVGDNGIITRVTQIVVYVVGIAAILMIIVSGLRYITSAGDPTGVNNAKNGVLYAVVGLVVAVSGQVIVTFVLGKL